MLSSSAILPSLLWPKGLPHRYLQEKVVFKMHFLLPIKSFCVCVLSLCVQSTQNYGCKLNYQFTAMLASIAWNVGFITETAGVSKPCLVGKIILNEYSIQLAFMPHLSLFLLDLCLLTVLIHFQMKCFTIVFIFMWVQSI